MRLLIYSPHYLRSSTFKGRLCTSPQRVGASNAEVVYQNKARLAVPVAVAGLLTAALLVVILLGTPVHAQSTASIEGQVNDQHGAIVPGVEITVVSREIGIRRTAVTDEAGRYQIPALPVGSYRIEVRATGFQTQIVESSTLEVGRRVTQNFQLRVGDVSHVVTVTTANDLIDQSSVSINHVVDQRMVQETPLNGRYFLDLALRVAGSVTPPQSAFSA